MLMWPLGMWGHQQATDEEAAAGERWLERPGSVPLPRCSPAPHLKAQHGALVPAAHRLLEGALNRV